MATGETIRELLVSIGIDADEKQLKSIDDAVAKIKEGLGNLADVAQKAAVAVTAFAAAAVYQAVDTATSAKQIEQQAAALGLSTDAYQELRYAVERYGGEAQDVSTLIAKLSVQQQAAAAGNAQAAESFAKLGITVDELRGADPASLLRQFADGMAATADPAARLALATALLGDDVAKKLVPLLAQGSAGLDQLAAQARELGAVLSGDDLDAADQFAAQWSELGTLLSAVRNEIGLALIPALSEIAQSILDWYKANRELVSQKIDEYAGKVGDAFTAVADAITRANELVGGVDGWTKLAAILAGLTAAGGLLYVAFQVGVVIMGIVDLVAAVAAFVGGGEVLLVILAAIVSYFVELAAYAAVVAAVFLIVEDFYTYLQGGDSVWGRLIERWRTAPGFLGAIARAMEALGAVGRSVLGLLSIYVENFKAALQPAVSLVEGLGTAIVDYIVAALDKAAPLLDIVTGKLNELAGVLGSDQAKSAVATAGTVTGGAANYTNPLYAASQIATSAQSAAAGFAPLPGSRYASSMGGGVTVGGDTITITGVGLTAQEAEELIARKQAEKSRATAATFQAAEV